MARCIAVVNQKGGVGKTTTTFNLAAGLVAKGKKVLCVDCDPQGSLTISFGFDSTGKASLYDLMKGNADLEQSIVKVAEGIDLIPADIELDNAETELLMEPGADSILRMELVTVLSCYDYILFDSRPSLGLLTRNAMRAANELLIVLKPEFLSGQGTLTLIDKYKKLKDREHENLKITGVVVNGHDVRRNAAKDILSEIEQFFDDDIFKVIIKNNSAIADSPSYHLDIYEYWKQSKNSSAKAAVEMYDELVSKIIGGEQ